MHSEEGIAMIRIKKIALAMAVAMTTLVSAQTMTATAVNVEKYVPIVDTLHVTVKEEPTATQEPENTDTTDTESSTKTYEDMTDPSGPLVGAGDVPASLKDKINTELHNDPVPDGTAYDGYYIIKDGEKTYMAGSN